jgi:predicted transcriptional regulator
MKSVLISTRPQWVEKICHKIGEDETGKAIYEKRIEVRKTAPKEVPFKCYIYETQGQYIKFIHGAHTKYGYGCGKVIGEFVCDKVEKLEEHIEQGGLYYILSDTFNEQAQLDNWELHDYGKGKTLYGWHISDLKIYDKPKELGDFKKHCHYKDRNSYCLANECEYYSDWTGICCNWVERPPLSWCYVEDLGEEE